MWAALFCTVIVAAVVGFLAAMAGMVAGIDWHERRRLRDLKRKRANIEAAIERDLR